MVLKKRFIAIVLLLLLVFYANAQEKSPSFEEESFILPPGPPELISGFNIQFELKDYVNKKLINDIHIYLTITNLEKNIETNTLKYIDEEGILKLNLNPGYYRIILKVDDINTLGKDYFFESDFDIFKDINQTIFLLPIGSLRGIIIDEKKAVPNANIKLKCSADYSKVEPTKTDSFGSFSVDWLPIGQCRVIAEYGKKMGFKDVQIKKGEISDIEINLEKRLYANIMNKLFFIIVFVLIIIFLIYFYYYKNKKIIKFKKEETKKIEISQRTKDVLNTLNDKEKRVISFLLENNYQATQARIRNETCIPKTSLARLFISLELKRIIKTEKIGKLKKISLTNWFLGKG